MPSGSGGAGVGANGLLFCGGAGVGVGDGVCAKVFAAMLEAKINVAANKWKVKVRTRFIFPPKE